MVETQSDEILRDADTEDVSLLVVGDPFGCVTHCPALTIADRPPAQSNNAHGHYIARARAAHPDARDPQRVDHERCRRVRSAAVQLRPDRLAGVLHGYVASGQLLRPRAGERRARDAYATPARYQGQGAERREHGPVCFLQST